MIPPDKRSAATRGIRDGELSYAVPGRPAGGLTMKLIINGYGKETDKETGKDKVKIFYVLRKF
jgi:hypothetical protein